ERRGFSGLPLLGVLLRGEPAAPGDHPRSRSAATWPAHPAAREHAYAAAERRLSRAMERSRPEPPRAGAPLAARRRGVRRVWPPDAPDGARREAAAWHGTARPGV